MRVAALLAPLLLSTPAFAQMPEFLVADFSMGTQSDFPVRINDRDMLEVLGFGIGMSGHNGIGRANALKRDGYTLTDETTRLQCRGQAVIGYSSRFVNKLLLRKRTNEFDDAITVVLASPYNSNQTFSVFRETRYLLPDNAPSAKALVDALQNKYGEPNHADRSGPFPTRMRWNFRGATLLQEISYFPNKPGIVHTATTELFRSIRGAPAPFLPGEQQRICEATRRVDQNHIRQLNERNLQGPKL